MGQITGSAAAITDSYCDATTTVATNCVGNRASSVNAANTPAPGYTTAQLQAPTAYTGIYLNWSIDLDGDTHPDWLWDFGAAGQYPKLNTPAQRAALIPARVDYDVNNNGLIEIHNLAQLNAMRHDLNGNGDATHGDYLAAFPNRHSEPATRMGCPSGNCRGYELMADLTFPTSTGPYNPWTPIGPDFSNSFATTFDGNGHTITGFNVDVAGYAGLFGRLASGGILREVGIINPNAQTRSSPNSAGGLVGVIASGGQVQRSYSIGGRINLVDMSTRGGGLVGSNFGAIRASYARTEIRTDFSRNDVEAGGLVGRNRGSITASYAAGLVSPTTTSAYVGGLVGRPQTGGTVTSSYCDVAATTTVALQAPTDYTGIYQHWNIDTDGDGNPDNPWDFGGPTDYPAHRVISRDSPPPGGPRYAQPPQDTPYNPAADHPEIYTNARYDMSADCAVQPNADGDPESSRITFDLGSYQGAVILHLAIWNGEFFMSYESQDIDMPPFEREGQTATVMVTTDPAQTRFLLDSVSPTTNLVLGYADCHTDDPGVEPESSEPAETSTAATPPPPKVYVNDQYEMTAACDIQNDADGEPESSLIRFDLGNYQGDVLLTMSLWNGEWYASYESLDIDSPSLARDGQSAKVRVTTGPAETRFLLDGTPNGLRTNLLLGYADCHDAG